MTTHTTPQGANPAPRRPALLRSALVLDGAGSAACGALLPLVPLDLGLPRPLLLALGAFLLGYGACAFLAGRTPTRARALAVIAFNTAWVAASALVVASGWFPLTTAGLVVLVAQALAVAAVTALQAVGLRRATRPARD
ncbi:hypothetical protein [Actinosynnema pretiosum]|uniref:Integral membrane protein n=1 Tax=Actinosynnema pretiosum TaxID=42197 RepID=A0A290ZDA7_9PSEU|nr:hypothetical protein [Actinosynnema pretiosum]ATE56953.1 hypothetical protein CNX65_29730 [Actinosynnema pretiosum]